MNASLVLLLLALVHPNSGSNVTRFFYDVGKAIASELPNQKYGCSQCLGVARPPPQNLTNSPNVSTIVLWLQGLRFYDVKVTAGPEAGRFTFFFRFRFMLGGVKLRLNGKPQKGLMDNHPLVKLRVKVDITTTPNGTHYKIDNSEVISNTKNASVEDNVTLANLHLVAKSIITNWVHSCSQSFGKCTLAILKDRLSAVPAQDISNGSAMKLNRKFDRFLRMHKKHLIQFLGFLPMADFELDVRNKETKKEVIAVKFMRGQMLGAADLKRLRSCTSRTEGKVRIVKVPLIQKLLLRFTAHFQAVDTPPMRHIIISEYRNIHVTLTLKTSPNATETILQDVDVKPIQGLRFRPIQFQHMQWVWDIIRKKAASNMKTQAVELLKSHLTAVLSPLLKNTLKL